MRAMALKLFRTTGYSTLLMPGEARLAPHPARLVLWGALWLALACNVALWRMNWHGAAAWATIVGGAAGIFLSVFGWRRTLRLALTLAFIVGALIACGLWTQQLPVETLWQGPPRTWLPAWASFLRWQVPALVLVLAVVPIVYVWNAPFRRLAGPAQLRTNVLGALLGAAVLFTGIFLIA